MRRTSRQLAFAAMLCVAGAVVPSVAHGQCDPQEVAKLLANDGASHGNFGYSVAAHGDVVLVGAPGGGDGFSGSAYLFKRDETSGWIQIDELFASDAGPGDNFGNSVDIAAGVAVVGAVFNNAAYVFRDDGTGNWIEVAKLAASDGHPDDDFGISVAIDGNTAIVGARHDGDNGNESGSAYVFRDDGTGDWIEIDKLLANDGAPEDFFGFSVDVDGDLAIVGAFGDDDRGTLAGCAYFFRDDGTSVWTQVDKVTAADGALADGFGWSVSISNNTALVGALGDDDGGDGTGSVYLFQDDGTGEWIQATKITASDAEGGDSFGSAVILVGGIAVVGAPGDDDQGSNSGSAYVFQHDGAGNWPEVAKIVAQDGVNDDYFGAAVGVSTSGIALVGAKFDDDLGGGSGSAYIFDLNCDTAIPANLTDFTVAFGTLISGTLQDLVESDDAYVRARSRLGFVSTRTQQIDVRIGAETTLLNATSLDLSVEGRISQPGGTGAFRLRNWNTNSFEQVHTYPIGNSEIVVTVNDVPATNRIRQSDGRIELVIRHQAVATFAASFDSFTDWVQIVLK